MKKKNWLTLGVIVCACYSYGQDTTILTRPSYNLIIATDRKKNYEELLKASPYILPDNTVQLYPGETVYIEVEQENAVIKNMKAVKKIIDSTKTLTISFTQSVEKNVHDMMKLTIANPFKQKLFYTASIFLLKRKKWVTTDVFPVEAGIFGIEMWPDIIVSIDLGQWELKDR